jgi:hypothetical protein
LLVLDASHGFGRIEKKYLRRTRQILFWLSGSAHRLVPPPHEFRLILDLAIGMQSLAFKHALCDHSQLMLAFNEGLAHNLGAAWRRFFKIADRVQARGPGFEGCIVNAKPISNHGHGHSCHL